MDFTFLWPYALGVLLLPVLVRLFFSPMQMLPYRQALCVPFFDVIQNNLKKTTHPYKKKSSSFFVLGYLFLTIAAMRPIFYAQPIYIPSTGRQLMLVLDVSGSMAEQDFVYNDLRSTRLAVVQNVAQDFIKSRQGDAVGLTIFGSEAFLYTPLTPDTQTASQMLTEIGVGMAGDRTAIGDALLVALKQMKDIPSDKKVIVLLSDGFANAGIVRPEEAIQVAKENDVKIYTVGLGSDKQTVQSFFFTQEINPSKDLDEKLLQLIASETSGEYFRVKTTADLEKMYDTLNKIEPTEVKGQMIRPQKEMFWVPLFISLILFFIGMLLKEANK